MQTACYCDVTHGNATCGDTGVLGKTNSIAEGFYWFIDFQIIIKGL